MKDIFDRQGLEVFRLCIKLPSEVSTLPGPPEWFIFDGAIASPEESYRNEGCLQLSGNKSAIYQPKTKASPTPECPATYAI